MNKLNSILSEVEFDESDSVIRTLSKRLDEIKEESKGDTEFAYEYVSMNVIENTRSKDNSNEWGCFYDYFWVMNGKAFPCPSFIKNKEGIEYLRKRTKSTSNVYLKNRYSGIVYELAKQDNNLLAEDENEYILNLLNLSSKGSLQALRRVYYVITENKLDKYYQQLFDTINELSLYHEDCLVKYIYCIKYNNDFSNSFVTKEFKSELLSLLKSDLDLSSKDYSRILDIYLACLKIFGILNKNKEKKECALEIIDYLDTLNGVDYLNSYILLDLYNQVRKGFYKEHIPNDIKKSLNNQFKDIPSGLSQNLQKTEINQKLDENKTYFFSFHGIWTALFWQYPKSFQYH